MNYILQDIEKLTIQQFFEMLLFGIVVAGVCKYSWILSLQIIPYQNIDFVFYVLGLIVVFNSAAK